MAVIANTFTSTAGHLRPFDVRRDLNPVADLVELCFSDTLDPEGERYLRQMRDAARSATLFHWASVVADQSVLPLSGYVWEEDGRVVGNLSLIPFSSQGQRYFLIANVAVHPDYRRRGIARTLTSTAQEQARRRRGRASWLHVREENEAARQLYLSLGFKERARRTTWQSLRTLPEYKNGHLPGLVISTRKPQHWVLQAAWLRQIYPPMLSWHLPFNVNITRPGLWGGLYRLFTGTSAFDWTAQRAGRLLAAATWQAFEGFSDYLWLATPPVIDGDAISALLLYVRQQVTPRRSLTLDFPARLASKSIEDAGFKAHQTLIWMTDF